MTSLGQHPVAHSFSHLYDTYYAAARSRLYETYGFSQVYDTTLIQRPVAHSFSQLYDTYTRQRVCLQVQHRAFFFLSVSAT